VYITHAWLCVSLAPSVDCPLHLAVFNHLFRCFVSRVTSLSSVAQAALASMRRLTQPTASLTSCDIPGIETGIVIIPRDRGLFCVFPVEGTACGPILHRRQLSTWAPTEDRPKRGGLLVQVFSTLYPLNHLPISPVSIWRGRLALAGMSVSGIHPSH
jgi:hypothetical protein